MATTTTSRANRNARGAAGRPPPLTSSPSKKISEQVNEIAIKLIEFDVNGLVLEFYCRVLIIVNSVLLLCN